MFRAIAVAVLVIWGAAACSSSDSPQASADKPTAAPTVSTQTTCDLLFTDDQPRLWSQAVSLIAEAQNGTGWAAGESEAVADQLNEAAESSGADLRPHIEAMAKAASTEPGQSIDAGAFKTAAREVANVCTQYVATN